MLTVMCPNCRHRFPAPGCCNPGPQGEKIVDHRVVDGGVVMQKSECTSKGAFYGGGYLLVPREYNENGPGCFINAPTIIHGPTIIQQPGNQSSTFVNKITNTRGTLPCENSGWKMNFEQLENRSNCDYLSNGRNDGNDVKLTNDENYRPGLDCHINTTCDLTGGTVTITTPSMQSGGCLIQSTDSGILVQAPRIEIRPKLSGGGCLVEKRLPMENEDNDFVIYRQNGKLEGRLGHEKFEEDPNLEGIRPRPPSGCQELPGIRRCGSSPRTNHQQSRRILDEGSLSIKEDSARRNLANEREQNCWRHREDYHESRQNRQQQENCCDSLMENESKKRHSTCCCNAKRDDDSWPTSNSNRPISSSSIVTNENIQASKKSLPNDSSNGMEIRVNATVQLPPNVGHCTVNITATTGNLGNTDNNGVLAAGRTRNNFNGGGLVQVDGNHGGRGNENNPERREDAPTTPVSWLMPCPWSFENYPIDKDVTRLTEMKRLLHTSGWYHEGLSWQQSETLLKNAPVGRWLMRDSSDSRFIFAVSVQTARGPTSVRVHYFLGRFRLDAEPRLSLAMPLFDCPIKMLEHYIDYSKRIDEHRKEVWVDYSGQLYSQIYLTKPLVKEVQTLSHLARIVVNSNKLSTDHLPPLMKNYLAEYPYSL